MAPHVLRICTQVIPRDRCAGPSVSAPTTAAEWMRATLPPVTARAEDGVLELEYYLPGAGASALERERCSRANTLASHLLVSTVLEYARDHGVGGMADFLLAPMHRDHAEAVVGILQRLDVYCLLLEQQTTSVVWAHDAVGCWELRCAPPPDGELPPAGYALSLPTE